jgi:transmembrane sensor
MSSVPLRLADGSVATPLDSASAIALRENSERRGDRRSRRGRGRFDVAPRAERQFSVRAGDVTITVLGTLFTVERVADRIGVGVERGRVLVEWATGSRRLDVGESGWFPPLATTEPVPVARKRHVPAHRIAEAAPASTEPAPAMPAPFPPAPAAQPAPFTQQRRRRACPPRPARDEETAETLLAAADAARLDGRALDGAAFLRRVLTQHRADPRAAAGRVHARAHAADGPRPAERRRGRLRRSSRAGTQRSFRRGRSGARGRSTGQGRRRRRRPARGRDYLRLYPNGRRAPAVRALGGSE